MKKVFILVLIFAANYTFAQQGGLYDSTFSAPGKMPSLSANLTNAPVGVTGIRRAGKEITAQGTLRVLVIFIRFKDDIENTPTWPDYRVLPDWAKNIVNSQVPSNGIYTPGNMSDFFDRASGGNGNGDLGSFRMIGDVYYETTLHNFSYYSYGDLKNGIMYDSVNAEIFSKIDSKVNYADYDNWQFMVNVEYYNHSYKPNVGDGEIDYIFIFYRDKYYYNTDYAGFKGFDLSINFKKDGKSFDKFYGGATQFGYKNRGFEKTTITIPAHEYAHNIFSGGSTTGHIDGRVVYGTQLNIGNIAHYGLMLSNGGENSFPSAYERYRAGWRNPTVVTTNQSSLYLKDTHIKHQAFLIPLRYNPNNPNDIIEYYLIENVHSKNDYSGANPFVITQLFNHTFTHGVMAFHIENEDTDYPMNSNIDIECADGLWEFGLTAGANTPSDRTDDKLAKIIPTYNTGFDERDVISVQVGSILYNDYYALTPASYGNIQPPNHGRRYYKDSYLGDNDDFFKLNTNNVFSPFSNPNSDLADGSISNVGFEVKSYDSNLKEYELSIQVNSTGLLSLSPSKPQSLTYQSRVQPIIH